MAESVDSKEFQEEWQKWVRSPQEKIEEVKEKARKAGQDPAHIARGYIIDTAIKDDGNSFVPIVLKGFGLEDARRARETIEWRLDWETACLETPEEARQQLKRVRQKLGEVDWGKKEGFDEAYNYWKKNARNWLIKFKDTNPAIKRASDDYQLMEGLIPKKEEPDHSEP